MRSTSSKRGRKSSEAIKEDILNDWADVRRWIDELQGEWAERRKTAEVVNTGKPGKKRRGSAHK